MQIRPFSSGTNLGTLAITHPAASARLCLAPPHPPAQPPSSGSSPPAHGSRTLQRVDACSLRTPSTGTAVAAGHAVPTHPPATRPPATSAPSPPALATLSGGVGLGGRWGGQVPRGDPELWGVPARRSPSRLRRRREEEAGKGRRGGVGSARCLRGGGAARGERRCGSPAVEETGGEAGPPPRLSVTYRGKGEGKGGPAAVPPPPPRRGGARPREGRGGRGGGSSGAARRGGKCGTAHARCGQRLHNAALSRERYGEAREPKSSASRAGSALKEQAPPPVRPFSRLPGPSGGGWCGGGVELPVVRSLRSVSGR